jgi:LysR family glycine cleavage system transcriptional activator
MRNLPPLNALRAFEAAGRHLSLTHAARELHVTPAAVSHQVKALEERLGVKLFRRVSRGLVLSGAGQALLPQLSEGFDRLEQALAAVERVERHRPLTVSVAPSFGAKWLVPRLERLREKHPELDVRIDANPQPVDLEREGIDVAVRYGPGRYPGLHVERLMDEEVLPVCSPALLARGVPLREPADLAHHPLLHHEQPGGDSSYPDWRMWLLAAGVPEVDATRGSRFTLAGMAVQAALDGQGVALVGRTLVERDVAAGRLVTPFPGGLPQHFAYWLVCPPRSADSPRVKAFRDWIMSEAG